MKSGVLHGGGEARSTVASWSTDDALPMYGRAGMIGDGKLGTLRAPRRWSWV